MVTNNEVGSTPYAVRLDGFIAKIANRAPPSVLFIGTDMHKPTLAVIINSEILD